MAKSREQIAARLKELRISLGFTQSQVADHLGLHRPAVSEIEAGRRAVTAEELHELARLYATSIAEVLSDESPTATRAGELLALRADDDQSPTCRTAIKQFIADRRAELELESMLHIEIDRSARRTFQLPEPSSKRHAIHQGIWLAREARKGLELGAEPIRNMVPLLAQQGVRLGQLRALDDESIDGLFFESDDLGPCVGINPRTNDWTGGRAAFTAAHEFAHCLLRDRQREIYSFLPSEPNLQEVRANVFAAAFLMPPDGVEEYFRRNGLMGDSKSIGHLAAGDIVRAMDYFGVSRTALLFRLLNLGMIPEALSKSLSSFAVTPIASALGITFRDRAYLGTRLPQLAVHAWRLGFIAAGRAADLCGLDLADFLSKMREVGEASSGYDGLPLVGASQSF